MKGKVYIVGAGPGDPKLLTLRALEVIKKADVVLYDRLVSAEVLQLLPKHARRRCVGKSPPRKRKLQQSEINDILIGEARRAQNVLRLKGGDPFIFSRGGEEAEALKRKGIDFEVVPGISSAIAAPLYAGIPLTHRDISSSVAITTTREASSKRAPRVKLSEIASNVDTLVILMGASTLGRSCMELIRGGLSRDTPVAAIQWATTERQ
ncbi:MAG: uroporphyrinogen-III C-methyltransferase, partial [Thaumarchaeota archaeon]|nr:uroporphyrinogen-III C-methyltransferase [Nitrososphaerota archaeon]